VALLCLSFLSSALYAQKSPEQVQELRQKVLSDQRVEHLTVSAQRQTPSFIALKGNGYSKDQARLALGNYLQVRPGVDYLAPDRSTRFFNDIEVIDFKQTFKGVKVEHATFKAFIKEGQVQFFNGVWYDIPTTLNIQPSLSKDQALGVARRKVAARKYATEELQDRIAKADNAALKEALQKELESVGPKGELVIVKDFSKDGVAELKLAYKFDIYAAEPLSRAWVYVDAQEGRVLLSDPIIKHANPNPSPTSASITTSVQTRYAGIRNIYVKQLSGNDPHSGQLLTSSHPTTELYVPGTATFGLVDDTRGGGVETYDMNGVGGLPLSIPLLYVQGKSFTDADNNWTLSEHKRGGGEEGPFEAENDDIAWDAHWGAEMVYDYWKLKQNRLSFDGNNAKIKSFIHYGPAYDNAFWNGQFMTYGDGSGIAAGGFKALTSLDVCGHEIGHGVCEFTANLVYEKESGAMNEGFSDIWAACVEHFVIKNIDPSLSNTYRPFYIGEQIGATYDDPLRRMDNPKAAGNPDTYGGANWENPDCSPDLVNDYCGVHNNSGLLNKWFYLMTVGSGRGSGPDAAYARPDSDDGVNDLGNSYNITGLGFSTSERIAYLTELMLTSTATFAEAREVSIGVATELSGDPCGALVETITNSWYAVGVGAQFVKPCTITYGFIYKPGITVTEGSTTAGCSAQKTITVPVLLPANSTATIAASGTAQPTQDYTLSVTTLSNTTASNSKQEVTVVLKNDAVIESDETIDLAISVNNTGANPVNTRYTVTITDDDVQPIIGEGEKQLLSEAFNGSDGFGEPSGWTEVLELAQDASDPTATTGYNQWGTFGGKLAITGKDALTGLQLPAGMYNPLSESKTYVKSPLIDARGLSLIRVKFDYRVQGEVDPQRADISNPDIEKLPVFDYMAVMYSLDGVNWVELNTGEFKAFASALPSSGSFSGLLPVSLSNKQFYIAFRWYNDTNAGGPESVSIDNLLVTGTPRKIENDQNHSARENVGAGQEVYFYSVQDGEVLGKVQNSSAKDFGCTSLYVEKTGTGTFNLYQDRSGLHKVADKVVRVETGFIYKAPTSLTLYFTEAQLQALELATGRERAEFSVYAVGDIAYSAASSKNTVKHAAVYTPIPGVGGSYSITLNDKANGSYALGFPVSVLGLEQKPVGQELTELSNEWRFASIYPNPGAGVVSIQVTAPVMQRLDIELTNVAGQVVYRQVQTVQPGISPVRLETGKLSGGIYMVRLKNEKGESINVQQFIKK
jgi:Zn-dependent metalloprotease